MRNASVNCPFCGVLNRVDLEQLLRGPKCGGCGRPLHLDRPQAISGDSLDRVLGETDVPVLLDCYAAWCAPCRIMAPLLDEVAHDRAGEILVAKLDTDRDPGVAGRLGVRSIPTLIVFVRGQEIARQVGVVPRRTLDEMLTTASAACTSYSPGATT